MSVTAIAMWSMTELMPHGYPLMKLIFPLVSRTA
jgi:hypothetical protein